MQTTTQNPAVSVGKNSFSLRALFIVVTGCAILFAYLAYFRSTQATVEYTSVAVESTALNSLNLDFNDVPDSQYKWTHLDDSDVKTLLLGSSGGRSHLLQKRISVHTWPMQAETGMGTRPVTLELIDPQQGEHPIKLPMFETATFGGNLGVRLAGRRLQFRIDAKVGYQRPDEDIDPKDMNLPTDEVEGRLFYQGKAPEHALMFAAPLDDHSYHVVLFSFNN
jgi:hypothetical protein